MSIHSDKLETSRTSLPGPGCALLVTECPAPTSLFPKVKSGKSILDVDPEAQALLEISGRSRHSEGLREVPDQE